jgi:hypothetical protein
VATLYPDLEIADLGIVAGEQPIQPRGRPPPRGRCAPSRRDEIREIIGPVANGPPQFSVNRAATFASPNAEVTKGLLRGRGGGGTGKAEEQPHALQKTSNQPAWVSLSVG